MNAFLKAEQAGDIESLLGSLVKLEVYLARANEMLAEAKSRKEEATLRLLSQDKMMSSLTPSLASKYLSASLRMESYAVDLADGVCSSIRNIMDSRRTRISALKEELRQLRTPDVFRERTC